MQRVNIMMHVMIVTTLIIVFIIINMLVNLPKTKYNHLADYISRLGGLDACLGCF